MPSRPTSDIEQLAAQNRALYDLLKLSPESNDSQDRTIEEILKIGASTLHATAGRLWLEDQDELCLSEAHHWEQGSGLPDALGVKIEFNSKIYSSLESRHPVEMSFNELLEVAHSPNSDHPTEPLQILIIPVFIDELLFGAISFSRPSSLGTFDDSEKNFSEALSFFIRQTFAYWEHKQIQQQLNNYSEELAGARSRAEEADKLKSEFLANMSHEIRTPMNGIIGLTQLVLEEELEQNQREMLTMVYNSAEALLTIINDILDFSKIEAGKLQVERIPFSLSTCLSGALHLLSEQAEKKEIEYIAVVDPHIPDQIMGDSHRLRQVIINLMGNAAKFTPRGGGIISYVEEEKGADGTLTLVITVADSGIGMSQEAQGKIFDSFTQADTSTTREFGGTGLGLSITLQLIQLMGGTIEVKSIEGTGSAFQVRLPTQVAPGSDKNISAHRLLNEQSLVIEQKQSATPASVSRTAKVLLVEDNKVNLRLAEKLLEKNGYEVVIAVNGREAVTKAETDSFDIILMDIQMPIMGGFEATEKIRASEKLREVSPTPIIAMTAHAMTGDREKCISEGMNDYVSKPIRPKMLFGVLDKFLEKGEE